MSKEFVVDGNVEVTKPPLAGFEIHNVVFKGAEKPDFNGKDGTIYKTVVLKFENEVGTFSATIFEPKDEDYTRKPSQFGGLNPCRVDIILDEFKQIVEAVNPTYYKEHIEGASPRFKNWEELRAGFVDITKPGIGVHTKIKLEKNKKGEAQFPAFPMTITRDGVLKRTSTYIGSNIAWTDKEVKAKNNYVAAAVTPMATRATLGMDLESTAIAPKSSSASLDLEPIGMDDL